MLLPESMSRIVIAGSRNRLPETIEAVYRLERAHLIDYSADDEGFSIGAPLPNGSKASERLLKIRAMLNELSIKDVSNRSPISAKEVRYLIESGSVEQLDEELFAVLDHRNKIVQEIADLESTAKDLEPLAQLPLTLDMYRGYESLRPFVGRVRHDPAELLREIEEKEFFLSDDGKFVALFVRKADEDAAQRALSKAGFTETPIPEGKGAPQETIASLTSKAVSLKTELADTETKLSVLKERHMSFVASTEEELAIEVEKAETPLRIATSDYSFIMDAWVPTVDLQMSVAMLEQALQGHVSIDVAETRARKLHDDEHVEKRFHKVPSKSSNGRYGKQFEYLTSLMSTPRYQESDPSFLIGIFLPLFFGIMLGDLGYAIVFIAVGYYGMKNWGSEEAKAVSSLMLFGGIWGAIFGVFMYGEMFGMHFIDHHHAMIPDWQAMLGMTFPAWVDNMTMGISKLDDVTLMLKLSVYIGIFHLFIGYVVGVFNMNTQHGFKHALIEKISWIMVLVGLSGLAWSVTTIMFSGASPEGMLLYVLVVGAVLMVAGLAMVYTVEGINAILEIPGVVGNILSYTRLAAIAMSKAGMALAFNYISIIMIAGGLGGVLGLIFGFLIFLVGHLLVWVLALISCGLHGLRLQYVEFMTKFFVGGGDPYQPLRAKRQLTKTIETEV